MQTSGAVILAIGTQESGSDTEEDRSLLYAYTTHAQAPGARVLTSLMVAAKGVLASVCGEKTRVVKLQHHDAIMTVAVAHLQACMLVVALPVPVEDDQAHQIALILAHTLLMLAGPSNQWLAETQPPMKTGHHDAYQGSACQLQPGVKVLFDATCNTMLHQVHLQPGGPSLLAPWLAFPGALAHMQLPPHRQRRLEELLLSHQDAAALAEMPSVGVQGRGSALTPSSTTHTSAPQHLIRSSDGTRVGAALLAAAQQEAWQPPTLQMYLRTCCMMYRGLLVVSGMSTEAEQLIWQCCMCMGLLSKGPEQEDNTCAVWVHQVDLVAACAEAGVTPAGVGGAVPSTRTAPEACLPDATTDTRATLVLAVAHGLVAAVLLQPFEPCVDMQVAGRLEGVAAAEWLHQVHTDLGADLANALSSSTSLSTYSPSRIHTLWGRLDLPGLTIRNTNATCPDGQPSLGLSPNHSANLDSPTTRANKILPAATGSPSKGVLARLLLQRGGGSLNSRGTRSPRAGAQGTNLSSSSPHRARTVSRAESFMSATSTVAGPDMPVASASAAAGAPVLLAASGTWGNGMLTSPFAMTLPTSISKLSVFTSKPRANHLEVSGPTQSTPLGTASSSTTLPFYSLPNTPKLGGGHPGLPVNPNPNISTVVTDPSLTSGSVALVLDLNAQRFLVFLDKLPPHCDGLLAAAWPVLAACHHKLQTGASSTVAVPPKHSRLCLTLEQMERLAALRAPPEAGLRLGHADSAPWNLHPELAPMAGIQQVVLQVPLPLSLTGGVSHSPSCCWYVSGQRDELGAYETLVLHSADVNEVVVQQQARLLLEQYRVDCL